MQNDIFTTGIVPKETETSPKNFITKNFKKIAIFVGIVLAILFCGNLTVQSDETTISSKEIQTNSLRWKELHVFILNKDKEIKNLEIQKSSAIKEQKELEARNEVLRKAFTLGKNQ